MIFYTDQVVAAVVDVNSSVPQVVHQRRQTIDDVLCAGARNALHACGSGRVSARACRLGAPVVIGTRCTERVHVLIRAAGDVVDAHLSAVDRAVVENQRAASVSDGIGALRAQRLAALKGER